MIWLNISNLVIIWFAIAYDHLMVAGCMISYTATITTDRHTINSTLNPNAHFFLHDN